MSDERPMEWLREDLKSLSEAVDRLERVTAQIEVRINSWQPQTRPCEALKKHLQNHEKATDRWWVLVLRVAGAVVLAGLSALAGLIYGKKI